jgi:hypothetical protein
MANRHRGEIDAELQGTRYTLCLTLGALAELEHAYGGVDVLALAERFEKGRIAASDCIKIIGAGLRGSGHDVSNDDVARMGGATSLMHVTVELLKATFGA